MLQLWYDSAPGFHNYHIHIYVVSSKSTGKWKLIRFTDIIKLLEPSPSSPLLFHYRNKKKILNKKRKSEQNILVSLFSSQPLVSPNLFFKLLTSVPRRMPIPFGILSGFKLVGSIYFPSSNSLDPQVVIILLWDVSFIFVWEIRGRLSGVSGEGTCGRSPPPSSVEGKRSVWTSSFLGELKVVVCV